MLEMSKRLSPSVPLTTKLAAFVAEKVGSSRYSSASKVAHTGLHSLGKKEKASPRRVANAECWRGYR